MKCAHRNGPIVLVSAPIAYTFPNSYAYLCAYLIAQGERPVLLFRGAGVDALVRDIVALKPLLVGFGSLYVEIEEVREIVAALNTAGCDFPVVVGGNMVSPTPEFAVRRTEADFGVIGEGEVILAQLAASLRSGGDGSDVKGLVIDLGDSVTMNTGPGEFLRDIAHLPPVPYELFPTDQWLNIGDWYARHYPWQKLWRAGDRVVNVHGGRGCPNSCVFCYHPGPCRYRPVRVMMEEAQAAIRRFDATMLYFSDDTVLASPARAREIAEGVAALDRRVSYSVSATFDALARCDDATVARLAETGCRIVGLGAESGANRILEIISPDSATAEEMRVQLLRLRDNGIYSTTTMQFGQLTETLAEANQTIEFVRQAVRDAPEAQWNFTVTTPFPGSPLYEMLIRDGRIRDIDDFHERYLHGTDGARVGWCRQVVNFSAMTDAQVMESYDRMWAVYRQTKSECLGRPIEQVC